MKIALVKLPNYGRLKQWNSPYVLERWTTGCKIEYINDEDYEMKKTEILKSQEEYINNRCDILEEKWFKFRRYYLKEGLIDCWVGDSINNPNDDKQSKWQLNATTTFYRLNNIEKWVHRNHFSNNFQLEIHTNKENSAQEIWNKYIEKETEKN